MAGGDRSGADSRLLAELTAGATVEAAATSAGMSARTAYRRIANPGFQRALSATRARLVERAVSILAAGAAGAAVELRRLASAAQSESVRLGAARAVLDAGRVLREQGEFEQRIAALEAATAASTPHSARTAR